MTYMIGKNSLLIQTFLAWQRHMRIQMQIKRMQKNITDVSHLEYTVMTK